MQHSNHTFNRHMQHSNHTFNRHMQHYNHTFNRHMQRSNHTFNRHMQCSNHTFNRHMQRSNHTFILCILCNGCKKKILNVQTSLVIHQSCTNYFSVQFYYSNQLSLSKRCQPLPDMGWQDPYVYAASSPVLWDAAVAPLQQHPLWKSSDPPLG